MSILSIQSHVSYGHAGNSSAVFPLQRLGHVVWPVYTVLFSNHTGHGKWRGPILGADVVGDIINGVFERVDYNQCDVMMTGYIGSPEIADVVVKTVNILRENNPDFIYSCDPVMGDYGRGFYTPEPIRHFFKAQMLELFDILLPNRFELEFLTGSQIETTEQAIEMAASLIKRPNQKVIVTSLHFDGEEDMKTLLVTKTHVYQVTTPMIPLKQGFAGSGDLFHALFIGNYVKNRDITHALEQAVNAIYHILAATYQQDSYELCIIPNQEAIVGHLPIGSEFYACTNYKL